VGHPEAVKWAVDRDPQKRHTLPYDKT